MIRAVASAAGAQLLLTPERHRQALRDLARIRTPLLTILFEDDELNPTDPGTMERVMRKVKTGRMVVIPAGPETEGHRTQVNASVCREHVRRFMETIARLCL